MTAEDFSFTDDAKMFFFFKGRVALYAILKAMGIGEGDAVLLPGFTCVVVPNVLKYLGIKPVYVDIDAKTYNMDAAKCEAKLAWVKPENVKAILAQNTFGLSSDLDAVFSVARKYNLHVIEDCAHGYGGSYKGRPNGTVADAAFYSSQWSKPFSTGLGGLAVTSDAKLAEGIKKEWEAYRAPGLKERLMLRALFQSYNALMNPVVYWPAVKAYRFLSRAGLVTGSSSKQELETVAKPAGFEKRMGEFQRKRAEIEMKNFGENFKHRQWVAGKYNEMFDKFRIEKPAQPDYAVHGFLRYPFLVKDKEKFLREAKENRIEAGDWFVSPLHPVEGNLSPWNYDDGMCPVAESVCKKIVNLPTHPRIQEDYLDRVEPFLMRMKEEHVL